MSHVPGGTTEYIVSFMIHGEDCHPDAVSALLEIVPTRAWRKGDKVQLGELRESTNGWEIERRGGIEIGLEGLIREVLAILDAKRDRAKGLPATCSKRIMCVVYSRGREATLHVSRATIALIAEWGADLAFDTYEMWTEED